MKICSTWSKHHDQYLFDNHKTNNKRNPLYTLSTMNNIFHDKITVLICEQRPYLIWFLCWRDNYLPQCEHGLNLGTSVALAGSPILSEPLFDIFRFFFLQCHESRSLARNRVIAREILRQKLDFLYNGKESELAQAVAKKKKKKANYARKRRLREEAIATGLQNVKDGPADSCDV